jgi:hypothetical protein
VADKHPYMSGAGGITQTVSHLRRSFPPQVTAETLKKLGIASNNETYVLNILRFIGVLDVDGKRNSKAATVFNKHDDAEFQAGFAELVATAYSDLLGLHGEAAWTLPTDKLVSYFRNTDHTSAIVGQRQASTFQALAALAGRSDGAPRVSAAKSRKGESASSKVAVKKVQERSASKQSDAQPEHQAPLGAAIVQPTSRTDGNGSSGMALTVRLEINLPAGGDQETYDRIFKSIRENLLNGPSA